MPTELPFRSSVHTQTVLGFQCMVRAWNRQSGALLHDTWHSAYVNMCIDRTFWRARGLCGELARLNAEGRAIDRSVLGKYKV
jgi:hypothetical protein